MATTTNATASPTNHEHDNIEVRKVKYLVFDHKEIKYHIPQQALWWPSRLFAKRREDSLADPGTSTHTGVKFLIIDVLICCLSDLGRPRAGGRTARNTSKNTPRDEFQSQYFLSRVFELWY
jgi:hypothetical protein